MEFAMTATGEGPGEIRRLSEDVVNRIAAGEIIQRPANALKELLENSLDAKSTNITITVKAGGLKYLQIQDNGSGIRSSDLGLVCERFTTSKLRQYEDLELISTYGFRGEALASISHIAHLTILTKTASDKCAYKASYEDGKLKGGIKPCAGNNGTTMTVEDLFYNVITRKKALRSPSEEYSHIMEVVGSYAVHNSGVGFALKKFGEKTDIKTAADSSVVENVRVIYGNNIARSLLEVRAQEPNLRLSLRGHITSVEYSNKRSVLLLFINHRLVHSVAIKKAIDSVYATYLPKNSHPFVYLSLEIDPHNVDVNVHPTKHSVHLLHEERIVEKVRECLESALLGSSGSRKMYTQARLPGASVVQEETNKLKDDSKVNPNNLVRMFSDVQKIDKFFPVLSERSEITANVAINPEDSVKEPEEMVIDTSDETNKIIDLNIESDSTKMDIDAEAVKEKWKANTINVDHNNITYIDPKESFKTRKFQYQRTETKLTSVKQLRMDIESSCNMNLREILANLIYIGAIDAHRSLIQHSTKLYLCDTTRIAEELFYETLLYDFQNLGFIRLSQPVPLQDLFLLALSAQRADWHPELGDKPELAQQMTSLLVGKRAMLLEYFSLEISSDGKLLSLPLLIDGHTPYMGALPTYLVRLVTDVDWEQEKACFAAFCRQTAIFYSQPDVDPRPECAKSEQWKHEHVLYPAVRKHFLPPKSFVDNGAILQIANLSDLYKVFERC